MQVMPTGIIFYGICNVRTSKCVAGSGAPVTAVWTPPGRIQVNVCKPCLDENIRQGEWIVKGARVRGMKQGFADIAVYSPDNELQMIAEIRNRLGASPEWAKKIFRSLKHSFYFRGSLFSGGNTGYFLFLASGEYTRRS